jgi:hypothetical protein
MRGMTDDAPLCVRCERPVVVNREWYDVFERMHFLCFHMEFERGDHDPDEGCDVPGCPVAETHATYLGDLGAELREQALAARKYARRNRDDGFAQSVAHGYYVVLSLMLQQGNAFQIPPETRKLDGLEPERDLL